MFNRKIAYGLSIGVSFDDLEWPCTTDLTSVRYIHCDVEIFVVCT